MNFPIRTELIDAGELTFEVDTCGAGKRLALCLHGFPESSHSWRHQLPLLAKLGYRAWAPNLRGYGQTTRPAKVSDYAMDHLLADVAALIDASEAESVLLIAHDWGGAIAWNFALRGIRPLERFIVMNIPHPKLFLKGLFTLPQFLRSWYMFFFQIPWLPEKFLGMQGAKRIGHAFTKMAVHRDRFPDELLDKYRQNALQPGALTAMLNYYRASFRDLKGAKAARTSSGPLQTPTLMIWGEQDTALGKELTTGTDEWVSDLTLRYIPDSSHWVQQDTPDVVNTMMEAWLTDQPVPEAG